MQIKHAPPHPAKSEKQTLMLWAHRVLIASFHALLLVVPLFFWFSTSELFEFNKMVMTYALAAIILAAWGAKMIAAKKLVLRRTPLDIPIIAFVISQLLATAFSIHPYTSFLGYYSRFHGGLLSTLTYTLLFYAFVTNVNKKELASLFLTTTISAVLVSIYASLEHFGHSVSCLIASEWTSFGVDCWVQDVQNRVFASFGQPNWLAAYLIMLIPLASTLALISKQFWLRAFYGSSIIILFATILFTKSRSGLLGLALGMSIFAALVIWNTWRLKHLQKLFQQNIMTIVIGLGLCLAILLTVDAPFTPTINISSSNTSSSSQPDLLNVPATPPVNRLESGGTDSGEIRKIVWTGAYRVWQRYPLLGSGVETFAYSYYLDRPVEHNFVSEWDFLYNKAHNEFLNFLATTGLVGLFSYLVLLGWYAFYVIKKILFAKKEILEPTQVLLTSAMFSGIIALSVSNFFGFSTVMVTALLYLFMAITIVINSEDFYWPQTSGKNSSTQLLLLSILGFITLFLLHSTLSYWQADIAYATGKNLIDAGQPEAAAKKLHRAIKLNQREASFYDELAGLYASSAVGLAQSEKWQEAQLLATAAEEASNTVMKLNPHQLNFYKTRARMYITLSQIDPAYLYKAADTMTQAKALSPTDPKILYNLGLIELSLEQTDRGLSHLEESVQLKPDYEPARYQLALAYYEQDQLEKAAEHINYILSQISPDSVLAKELAASVSAKLMN